MMPCFSVLAYAVLFYVAFILSALYFSDFLLTHGGQSLRLAQVGPPPSMSRWSPRSAQYTVMARAWFKRVWTRVVPPSAERAAGPAGCVPQPPALSHGSTSLAARPAGHVLRDAAHDDRSFAPGGVDGVICRDQPALRGARASARLRRGVRSLPANGAFVAIAADQFGETYLRCGSGASETTMRAIDNAN